MKRQSVLVFSMIVLWTFLCFGLPQQVHAELIFDNGLINDISYTISEDVKVLNSSLGTPTTLNLLSGGETGEVDVYNSSLVNVFDGLIRHNLDAHDSSLVNVLGGTVGSALVAFDSSQVTISGGLIKNYLLTYPNSQVTISGGQIDDSLSGSGHVTITGGSIAGHLQAGDSGIVTIYGGSIGSFVEINSGGQITISGGSIGGEIWAGDGSGGDNGMITFVGSDFAINGNPIAYGQYFTSDYASGHLAGILADGSLLDNDFYIGGNSSIVLVPEPSTLLLLGLGAVMLRKRRSS